MTSAKTINDTVKSLGPYLSNFTGAQHDEAVEIALSLRNWLSTHVQIPVVIFTGDEREQEITTLEEAGWLHQIMTYPQKPFSKSTPLYEYDVRYRHPEEEEDHIILKIIPESMMTEDLRVTYTVDQEIPAGATILVHANTTNTFGEFQVKLIMS